MFVRSPHIPDELTTQSPLGALSADWTLKCVAMQLASSRDKQQVTEVWYLNAIVHVCV